MRGFDKDHRVPGPWGELSSGAGAAIENLRGLLRPDLVVLNLDAPEDGADRAYYRVLSPPLPTWNLVRRRDVITRPVDRLAASVPPPPLTAPASKVLVVAATSAPAPMPAAGAPVTVGVWDETDLNVDDGSQILEFVGDSVQDARPFSPVAVICRASNRGDAFWFGTTGHVRTRSSQELGNAPTPAKGPAWSAATSLPSGSPARVASPLAAATIHQEHMGVFFVGTENEIRVRAFRQATGWTPEKTVFAGAQSPRVLAAARRGPVGPGGLIDVFVGDAIGAVWVFEMDDQNNFSIPPTLILPPGTRANGSLLSAVSRDPETVDLFWIGPAQSVGAPFARVFSGTWHAPTKAMKGPPFEIGGGHLAMLPGSLAAVDVDAGRLQVFWHEPDRSIWSTWSELRPDGTVLPYLPPVQVAPASRAAGGNGMAAASREADKVRLFFIDSTSDTLAEIFWGMNP